MTRGIPPRSATMSPRMPPQGTTISKICRDKPQYHQEYAVINHNVIKNTAARDHNATKNAATGSHNVIKKLTQHFKIPSKPSHQRFNISSRPSLQDFIKTIASILQDFVKTSHQHFNISSGPSHQHFNILSRPSHEHFNIASALQPFIKTIRTIASTFHQNHRTLQHFNISSRPPIFQTKPNVKEAKSRINVIREILNKKIDFYLEIQNNQTRIPNDQCQIRGSIPKSMSNQKINAIR